MAKNLVIVESPAKAKTINKYLGRDFLVKASMGHVRDLPKNPKKKAKKSADVIGGVDTQHGFAVEYEILPSKKKVVDELLAAAKDAEVIYLAADPDREGEAICWHLSEALGGGRPKKKFRRVVFNEITKRAVEEAFQHPGEVNEKKVDAQQTRRILDRLVGYGVSPILWNKVRRGLSAGRVQSVALKLICDREREIKAFVPEEYWSVLVHLQAALPPAFTASLAKKDGQNIEITSEEQASAVRADLEAARYQVAKVVARERRRNPVPPFTTSKLQQEAFKKLRFPVKRTMQVAQRLYEGVELGSEGSVGLITYMRTDSTRVADEAVTAVRARIAGTYGDDFVPDKPNVYRSGKGAQEAHEAIRPTYLDHDPESIKEFLSKEELALYRLIWMRFVASQMRPAVYDETAVDISAGAYLVRARGSVLKFKGFLAVYEESPDEKVEQKPGQEATAGAEAAESAAPEAAAQLPPLAEGDVLKLEKVQPDQHFTIPPPRYSEASLVKELEENGIGRPSTYAQIISTIETREYIEKREAKLYPTEVGFVVTDLLSQHFQDIVNVEYTAAMEEELDQIEEGTDNLLNTLNQFWKKFKKDLGQADKDMPNLKGKEELTEEICEKCGRPMVKKWGRYGTFLACSGYPECRNTRQLAGEAEGMPEVHESVAAEVCPVDAAHGTMVVKKGRFGPFLACSRYPECKATKRLIRGEGGKLTLEVVKPLDENCPDCGKPLAWRRGRFGPFIACSTYPECKYIKKKEVREIGLLCPECGQGQVVERKGRWGRLFYGCRRYPECKFTAYHKPLAEPCPKCGRPYLLEKETKKEVSVVFCDNDGCGYERGADGTPLEGAAPAPKVAARKAPVKKAAPAKKATAAKKAAPARKAKAAPADEVPAAATAARARKR